MDTKKIWMLLGLLFFTGCNQKLELNNIHGLMKKAELSAEQNDHHGAAVYYEQALRIIPTHPGILLDLARQFAQLKDHKRSLDYLSKAVGLGYVYPFENDPVFDFLEHIPEAENQALMEKIRTVQKPIHKSKKAWVLKDRLLIPEGIAYDPNDSLFYMGSTYQCKIIRMDHQGTVQDFTREKQDGLRTVLGLKIDPDRQLLWALSTVGEPPPKDVNLEEIGWSGVFKYDIKTRKLLKKYIIHKMKKNHLFNDLVVSKKGDVYITDSDDGAVYTIPQDTDSLVLYLKSHCFQYPNGIALSLDEKKLYVANSKSEIFMINLRTKEISLLKHPVSFTTYGIDGLYFFEGTLLAIQNRLGRITQFYLNDSKNEIQHMRVLECNNPLLHIPTTGTVVGNSFYYIANCPLTAFGRDGTLNQDLLHDVIIMNIELLNEYL